jgi:hypothetical protein
MAIDKEELLILLQENLTVEVSSVEAYDPFGDNPDKEIHVRVLFMNKLIAEGRS